MKKGRIDEIWHEPAALDGRRHRTALSVAGQSEGVGFDGVELPMFEFDVAQYGKIGAELNRIGLASTAVTVCPPEQNPISPDPAIFEGALERLKQAIDCCAAAGSTVRCGPIHSALGTFSGTGRTPDEWNRAMDVLNAAGDHAKACDVTLVVEYLNRFECYFLNCAEEAG